MSSTGLFFGSFNPIHNGHLIVAQYMLNHTDIGKVRFIVSPHNPLKEQSELWDAQKRLQLVHAAIKDNPGFEVSSVEFDMPRPSYTIDTLDKLKQDEPGTEFSLIMGSDNLENLSKWKDYDRLISNFRFHIYKRPGFEAPAMPNTHFTLHHSPLLDISATIIRKHLQAGKSVRYLVPDAVLPLL